MARRSVGGSYPANWPAIAKEVKDASGWRCIRCKVAHDPPRHVLTVHHLDMNPSHSGPEYWWNLLSLCARCHLHIQGRVDVDRPWIFEHSAWFQPYVAGFYAKKYLGLDLSRSDVKGRLDELLALERQAVLS